MCINLFTNNVGPILLVLYLSKHFKLRQYITLNVLYKIHKKVSYSFMYL